MAPTAMESVNSPGKHGRFSALHQTQPETEDCDRGALCGKNPASIPRCYCACCAAGRVNSALMMISTSSPGDWLLCNAGVPASQCER